MKKLSLIGIILPIFILSSAYAQEAKVEIRNNVNSNSNNNSTNQATSRTSVTVETNGKVTHYESDKPGDISVKSVNGNSEIKVNGVNVSSSPKTDNNPSISQSISQNPNPSPSRVENEKNDLKKRASEIDEIVNQIKEKVESLKNIISSFFDQN